MTTSYLASIGATRDVLMRHGLATKKALGQHFLVDDNIIRRIVSLANPAQDDILLEVGPGIGTLTVALLPLCRSLIAIERDRDLYPVLAETCAQDSEKFELIKNDALLVSREDLMDVAPYGLPSMMVANLPYAVAATIVLDYFERFDFLRSATIMVQKEVADRMAANPGTKDYGAYTIKLRLRAKITGRFEVSPRCFFPPPRVESAVIRMERTIPEFEGAPASAELIRAAATAADAAFTQRRKNIRNSMGAYLSSRLSAKEAVDGILEQAGIAPTLRVETLEVDDFLRLGQALIDHKAL
ncbi:MAG: 16S rRNA (adenine(1518)-N(6)/adenine(1519)-N(6))-dimethyltransferase RsmA [Actinobacteria bacterium]|nr:16S rRNA (adenine(1518)-N(6)/adenine(1519)-N(6))-dimethyltransferase RsmA [Actinomycetota bacterium]